MRLKKSYKGNLITMSVKLVRDRQLIGGTAARLEHCTGTIPCPLHCLAETDILCDWFGWLPGPLITT